jgi:hypothetical protein
MGMQEDSRKEEPTRYFHPFNKHPHVIKLRGGCVAFLHVPKTPPHMLILIF